MPDFSRFAAEFLKPFTTPELGRLFNGILTLTLPDGGHRTFRIRTKYPKTKYAGRRVIGILVGPQNTSDYDEFAFVDVGGIKPFRRVLGTADEASAYKRYADLLWRMAGGEVIEGYSVVESRTCLRCNRVLSTPRAILVGLGSECEAKALGEAA